MKKRDFKLGPRNLLVTFHPITLDREGSELQMTEMLAALSELENTRLVFTMPNSDPEGLSLSRQIEEFCGVEIMRKPIFRWVSCAIVLH